MANLANRVQWIGCAALVIGVGISLVVAWQSSEERQIIAATDKYLELLVHPYNRSHAIEARKINEHRWWVLVQHPLRHKPEWCVADINRLGDLQCTMLYLDGEPFQRF